MSLALNINAEEGIHKNMIVKLFLVCKCLLLDMSFFLFTLLRRPLSNINTFVNHYMKKIKRIWDTIYMLTLKIKVKKK